MNQIFRIREVTFAVALLTTSYYIIVVDKKICGLISCLFHLERVGGEQKLLRRTCCRIACAILIDFVVGRAGRAKYVYNTNGKVLCLTWYTETLVF